MKRNRKFGKGNETENLINKVEDNKENSVENEQSTTEIKENKGTESKCNEKKNKGPLKVIIAVTQSILWILVIIMAILVILTAFSGRTDIFGHRLYIVMSGSMEPAIEVKDAVITKQEDNYEIGDVIAYVDAGSTVIHRIVKVYTTDEYKLYQTKGDNNNTEDRGLVQQSQIRGKLIYKIPWLGRAMIFIQSHLILFVAGVGILTAIILIRRLI